MSVSRAGSPAVVRPLGVFGPPRRTPHLTAAALTPLRDGLAPQLRAPVASYLRSGTVVLAFMEYTTDVLGARFGVSGGSGLLTDGTYYWRLDGADYVMEYGILLPSAAVTLMRENLWTAPLVEGELLKQIDRYLFAELSTR